MDPDPQRITLEISSNIRRFRINQQKSQTIVNELARALDLPHSWLHLSFVGPKTSASLNTTYRQKARATDVLSFPQDEWPSPVLSKKHSQATKTKLAKQSRFTKSLQSRSPLVHLGDIIICPDVAERNARAIGHKTDREICFLIIHGLLHLCGHDHMQADEAEVMYEQQRLLLDALTPKRGDQKPLWHNLVTKNKNLPRRRS